MFSLLIEPYTNMFLTEWTLFCCAYLGITDVLSYFLLDVLPELGMSHILCFLIYIYTITYLYNSRSKLSFHIASVFHLQKPNRKLNIKETFLLVCLDPLISIYITDSPIHSLTDSLAHLVIRLLTFISAASNFYSISTSNKVLQKQLWNKAAVYSFYIAKSIKELVPFKGRIY